MNEEMKSLRQIIVEKGADYESEEIVPNFVGLVDGDAKIIHAILDRTAVVYRFGDNTNRKVRRLEKVFVWPRDVRWQPRPTVFRVGFGLTRFDSTRNHARARRNGKSS